VQRVVAEGIDLSQSSPAARARSTVVPTAPLLTPGSVPPLGGFARGSTSVAESPVSGAWTVARWPSLPFRGADGPADGPASLGFGHRPDHDAPIPVITMPIFLITIDRSG
jgi:hypothetical protein